MKLRNLWKAAAMLSLSAILIVLMLAAGLLSFTLVSGLLERSWTVSAQQLSQGLDFTGSGYSFDQEELLDEHDLWAMLIGQDGRVLWSYRKPSDVPEEYSLTQVASFVRWYLNDYPVQTRIRADGLLVVGGPKNSTWKHDIVLSYESLSLAHWWFGCLALLTLAAVLGLSALMLRRWFHQEQQSRDAARSDWINGISHDIRTPLSLVMGHASQLERDPSLEAEQHRRATIIRRQSQTIRELVNDLNLTMRLDSIMQPLRRETVSPSALLRQAAADLLNSGQADGYPLDLDLPEEPLPPLEADTFLLRRAIGNLLTNCVRHNRPGCPIRLGGRVEGRWLLLCVESGDPASSPPPSPPAALAPDGGAAHGTGLKLVAQIAAAHGGTTRFFTGDRFRCELRLPLSSRPSSPS